MMIWNQLNAMRVEFDRPHSCCAIALRRNRIFVFVHLLLFFSHDGKETKDLAPSKLPPHL